MKRILFEEKVSQRIVDIRNKDRKLYKQIIKQLSIFRVDPTYPSLRLHKLRGNLGICWSISINKSVRLVYKESNDSYVFIDLGTHDEVYRK